MTTLETPDPYKKAGKKALAVWGSPHDLSCRLYTCMQAAQSRQHQRQQGCLVVCQVGGSRGVR